MRRRKLAVCSVVAAVVGLMVGGVFAQEEVVVNVPFLSTSQNILLSEWAGTVFRLDQNQVNEWQNNIINSAARITELEARLATAEAELDIQENRIDFIVDRQNFILARLSELGVINPDDVPGGFTPTVIVTP